MKLGIAHKHSSSAYSITEQDESSQGQDELLPRTYSEDRRKWVQLPDNEKPKRSRPSHKRTMSDTSHSPARERSKAGKGPPEGRRLDLGSVKTPPNWEGHCTERPQSPSDEEMSESELMIRRIIHERVAFPHQIADLVVEARSSEEEESDCDTPCKSSVHELGELVQQFLARQSAQSRSEQEQRRELKRQILALMQTDSEEKLSQRQTPQMSMLLSEALRSSSTSTIMGPGGSFHVQDIFSSDDSIQELNEGIAVNPLPGKTGVPHTEFSEPSGSLEISPIENRPPLWKRQFFPGNIEEVQEVLEKVCLPGDLFLKQKKEVVAVLKSLPETTRVAILLSSGFPRNQYCGIYEVRADTYVKVTASVFDPDRIPVEDIDAFLLYDTAHGDFVEALSRNAFHAFRLRN